MLNKNDINLAKENALLANQLLESDDTQKKIYQTFAVVAYSSMAYTAYRVLRATLKTVRRNK